MDHIEGKIHHLIEIRGVFDGWSIAVMEDGTKINRWLGHAGYEARAKATQEYIEALDKNPVGRLMEWGEEGVG